MEKRNEYFSKVISSYLNIPENFTIKELNSSESLNNYLENGISESEEQLFIALNPKQKKITVSSQIEDCIDYGKIVGLSKLRKVAVTADNIGDTIQMTLFNNQNPVDSLYHNIHSVYAPLLLKNSKWGINTKMQTLLTELDHGLSKSLRHSIDKNQ
eukprot:jgi/Orpsp1_1/1191915/evm.model.d7180000089348.1